MIDSTISALGYLEVGVSNREAWQTYAEEVLGVECIDAGEALHLRYDDACWRIRIVETGEDDIRCAGYEVAHETDLQTIGARLQGLGFTVSDGSADQCRNRNVSRLLVCQDPFGLAVELYVGDRASPDPCRLPIEGTGFVTGDQGLGHMVLTIADQDAAERFYMQGLGFLLSDHILLGPPDRQICLTFLHCNPRHHTLALAPVPAPKRLNHIMLQVTSLDEVGYGLDRANKAGVPVSTSLGKHTNDHMVSFYMQTPSRFDVEYGFGGVEIDDATWKTGTHDATSIWGHQRATG